MSPQTHVLPGHPGSNPVNIIDCGSMSLEAVIEYCNRVLDWDKILLPMAANESGTRGKLVSLADITPQDIQRSSVEANVVGIPETCTIRRLVIGNGVLAVISEQDGKVLDCAVEAVSGVEKSTIRMSEQYFDQDEDDWEDYDEDEDEEDDELEDDNDEEEEEIATKAQGLPLP